MKILKKLQCLDASMLKIFAMLFMVVDHIGAIIYPELMWIRILGRVSFPIFAFFVAEGYVHTRNPLKYMLRMAVFAVITEPIFDYAFFGRLNMEHQNVMFTFLLALAGLYFKDKIENVKCDTFKEMYKNIAGYIVVLAFSLISEYSSTDYGCYGVMLVYIYYILHNSFLNKHILSSVLQIFGGTGIQQYSVVSTIPLMMYNGKRGIGMKYLFYAFYPVHLLVLHIIAGILG